MILRCAICATEQKVAHFNLTSKGVRADGTTTRRGSGRIDLCARCWEQANEAAAIRPRRRTPRRRLEIVA